ncbi:MAG TPA: hypothetical protein VFS97_00570 [Nitrososphaeraceae archaeon]|nr:hypothetical protein [Nitrososphaeraceae archaeon]
MDKATKYIDALGPALGLPIPPGTLSILSSLGLGDPLKAVSNLIYAVKCKLNPNDSIGEVNQLYPGPTFGLPPSLKTVESDTGDFILTYSISPSA